MWGDYLSVHRCEIQYPSTLYDHFGNAKEQTSEDVIALFL